MEDNKTICLICQNYSNHITAKCPKNKCKKCGLLGHINKDCLMENGDGLKKESLKEIEDTIPLKLSRKTESKTQKPIKKEILKSSNNVKAVINDRVTKNESKDEQFDELVKIAKKALKRSEKLDKKYKKLKKIVGKEKSPKKSPNLDQRHSTRQEKSLSPKSPLQQKVVKLNEQKLVKLNDSVESGELLPEDVTKKLPEQEKSVENLTITEQQEELISRKKSTSNINKKNKKRKIEKEDNEKFVKTKQIPPPTEFHSCENDTSIVCLKCLQFKFNGSEDYAKYRDGQNYEKQFDIEVSSEIYHYLKSNRVVMKLFETRTTSQFKLLETFIRFEDSKINIEYHSKHLPKDRIRYSDLAKMFIAQVPRHVNYEILKLNEDLITTSLIKINPNCCQRVKLRTTKNTRYQLGDEIQVKPNCQFVKVEDEKIVLRLDEKFSDDSLVVYITLKNVTFTTQYCLLKHWRFGKIISVS